MGAEVMLANMPASKGVKAVTGPTVPPFGEIEVDEHYFAYLEQHTPTRLLVDNGRLTFSTVKVEPAPEAPASPSKELIDSARERSGKRIIPPNLRDHTLEQAKPLIEVEDDVDVLRAWSERDDRKGLQRLVAERLEQLEG